MKRLGTLLVVAVVAVLVSARAFAEAPVPAKAAVPEPAQVAFLQSLQADPAAPALPDFFTGQPAPTPRSCLGNCFNAYQACKATCGGDTACLGNCFDLYDGCRCSCGSCR